MACQTVGYTYDINAGDFDLDFWCDATSAYQVHANADLLAL